MPRPLPRGLRADTVIGALEKAGGRRRPGKGSHVNVRMPNGLLVTIPAHGAIKVGLLSGVIRKAGITVAQFLELIGR